MKNCGSVEDDMGDDYRLTMESSVADVEMMDSGNNETDTIFRKQDDVVTNDTLAGRHINKVIR